MKLLHWNLIWNKIMLPSTPTQHYLVWIRLQLRISFVTSFTSYKLLKKYYFKFNYIKVEQYTLSFILLEKISGFRFLAEKLFTIMPISWVLIQNFQGIINSNNMLVRFPHIKYFLIFFLSQMRIWKIIYL